MRVLKYRIDLPRTVLMLPPDAKFRHAGEQNGELYAWYEQDAPYQAEKRFVYVVGTGHEVIGVVGLEFMATVQMSSGFVWHLYEANFE